MKPSQIDLNLLIALDALLTERNVSRASQLVATSQPHMSRLLGRLRRLFNDDLLVRVGNEYQLTPLARELALPVRDVLRQIEETITHRLDFDPAVDERVFSIAASEYATFVVLRPLVRALLLEAPGVTLRIRGVTGNRSVEQIEAGDVDLGVWTDRVRPPRLRSETVLEDRMVLVASVGAAGQAPASDDYAALPKAADLWDQEDFTGLADAGQVGQPAEGYTPLQINGSFMKLFLLHGTGLVTRTQERLARQVAAAAGIQVIESPVPNEPVRLNLYWNPRRSRDPALTWLRTRIRQLCETL